MIAKIDPDAFEVSWEGWHAARQRSAAGPYGLASLAGTHWLEAEPQPVPGVVGRWSAREGQAFGRELGGEVAFEDQPRDELSLAAGQEASFGQARLTVSMRDGEVALRVNDPAAPARQVFRGIETFPPSVAWVLAGRFHPADTRLDITTVDGHRPEIQGAGQIEVEVQGRPIRLSATQDPDGGLHVIFSDATNGPESYGFRFLRVEAPIDGAVTVDFNRAFLPPCAFADHYLCPLPPPENRLTVGIEAGELRVQRAVV